MTLIPDTGVVVVGYCKDPMSMCGLTHTCEQGTHPYTLKPLLRKPRPLKSTIAMPIPEATVLVADAAKPKACTLGEASSTHMSGGDQQYGATRCAWS